jgi:hypothetical protein
MRIGELHYHSGMYFCTYLVRLGCQAPLTCLRDGVGEIREEGNIQLAQAALTARRVHPRQVGEVRVHTARHNLNKVRPS